LKGNGGIVAQTIPAASSTTRSWTGNLTPMTSGPLRKGFDLCPATGSRQAPEPNTRYLRLLEIFRAQRLADPHSPTAPTLIARRFNEDRQLPEERVRKMFEQVLASPLAPRVGALIEKRLGRPLEPFDIWYSGFRPRLNTERGARCNSCKKIPLGDSL
jgi:hypothetical protein